jgi:hypothetical protein
MFDGASGQTQDATGNAMNVTGRGEISNVQRHQPILHQRGCRIALPTRRTSICELADVNQELEQDAVEYQGLASRFPGKHCVPAPMDRGSG